MDSKPKEPLLAAALSLIIPGAGQVYIGRVKEGVLWLLGAIVGYMLFVIPGLIVHVFCIAAAYAEAKGANDRATIV